jgi:hypothetical protein
LVGVVAHVTSVFRADKCLLTLSDHCQAQLHLLHCSPSPLHAATASHVHPHPPTPTTPAPISPVHTLIIAQMLVMVAAAHRQAVSSLILQLDHLIGRIQALTTVHTHQHQPLHLPLPLPLHPHQCTLVTTSRHLSPLLDDQWALLQRWAIHQVVMLYQAVLSTARPSLLQGPPTALRL